VTHAINLPFHIYGCVERSFLSNGERDGYEPAVWFGLTLPANRAVGLTVLLECGAIYRCVPPHVWAFREDAPPWSLQEAQEWDCFGGDAQAIEYSYLRELPTRTHPDDLPGSYLFTLEFANDGFSRYPAQSKALHALELDTGRLTLLPGNRVVFCESSFTRHDAPPTWLRRDTQVWGTEGWEP
jgi:hypothetical protein